MFLSLDHHLTYMPISLTLFDMFQLFLSFLAGKF